jgi:hypothetical protein
LVGEALDRGAQLPAGAAPGRPEVNEHGLVALDYFLFPISRRQLNHIRTCHLYPLSSLKKLSSIGAILETAAFRPIIRMPSQDPGIVRIGSNSLSTELDHAVGTL